MKNHTTFRIGGNAEVFAAPDSADGVERVLQICREENIPCTVIGNGSNLLVGDRGVCGVVLQIYRNYASIRIEGTDLYVQAGALLGQTAAAAAREGLTGLEFASGIPGTIGGAAAMNAGAYGGEMKDVLVWVKAIDRDGYVRQYAAAELELGYRTSRIQKEALVVLEVKLTLQQGDPVKIRERMEELKEQRVAKQPLEYPSAGSTFKRPEGYFAGKLIMDAGLRGFSVGDAQVSEKHCGFVINRGNATAADVMALVSQVQTIVEEKFGVQLELEVRRIGTFE
ncbi:UDP-N-acetylmuramate dehydrogenase [Oscillospiraceae bacterium NTUH-002-81]|nr:UDP-N-acetylmuramate dehydrogenase [Oscillospiraceae bacterium NTUH-002-81]